MICLLNNACEIISSMKSHTKLYLLSCQVGVLFCCVCLDLFLHKCLIERDCYTERFAIMVCGVCTREILRKVCIQGASISTELEKSVGRCQDEGLMKECTHLPGGQVAW